MNEKKNWRFRVVCGAALMAFGLAGMTFGDTEVSTVEALINAVSSSAAGSTIRLAPGTYTDCKFFGCTASYNGGAGLYADYVSCLFETNSAPASGALWWPVVCKNCTFEGNRATSGAGGAVSMENTKTMTNCTFIANAALNGGALNLRPNDKVLGWAFIRNTDTSNGGAINGSRSNGATDANGCRGSVIGNCTFVENVAGGLGGAVYDELNGVNLPMDVYGCAFTNNAADKGGAMYSGRARTSVFFGNHANRGGAVFHKVADHSNHWAVACNFVSNYVTGADVVDNRPASGGAIHDETLGTSWQAHPVRFTSC